MRKARFVTVLILVAAAKVAAAQMPPAGVQEFRIEDAWGRDTVEFRTSAPMEEIVGTTNRVTGVLKADPKHLKAATTTARIEVPLASIKTGIAMRDGHVAKALGADEHPKAVFQLDSVGTALSLTYRSASPVPPEILIVTEVLPEGTVNV